MNRQISGAFWLAIPALLMALADAVPAFAQDDCSFERGQIPVERVNRCFADLRTDVEGLKSASQGSSEISGTIDRLQEQIDRLQQDIARLSTTGAQFRITETIGAHPIEFGKINPVPEDGLIIAFWTDKGVSGDTWTKIDGLVDPDIDDPTIDLDPQDPDVLRRATDSFSTSDASRDRSATIVMPVYRGESYLIHRTGSEAYNEDIHDRGIYFISVGLPE